MKKNKYTASTNITSITGNKALSNAYPTLSSISACSYNSNIHIPESTDIYIGNKTIDDYVNEKTQEKIAQNLDKVATRLPTDIALGDKEFLIIKVEVGDMPREAVGNYLLHITKMFESKGLTRVIVYPTFHGEGEMQYSKLDIEDKIIE